MSYSTQIEKILNRGWYCFNCSYLNPRWKPNRKRNESQKVCIKCGAKRPIRVL